MEIVLVRGTALMSRLIIAATGFPYSHSAMRYTVPDDNWIVHANLPGVVPEWWHYFEKHYPKIIRYTCTVPGADTILDTVIPKIWHKSYDVLGLFGFGLVLLLRRFGINIKKNPLGSKNNMFCTEVIVAFLEEIRIKHPELNMPKFESDLTDLKQLQDFMVSRPDLFKEVKLS